MEAIRKRSKMIWIVAGIIALAVILFFVLRNARGSAVSAQPQTGDTVTAFIGDLAASASASGQLLPQREARLALATSGRVEQVHVEVGDVVAQNDPLVSLESDALQRGVTNAEEALRIQEANLARLQNGATASDIAAAQAAVTSAQAQLNNLLQGPNEDEVAAAEANLRAAEANVVAASENLQQAQAGAGEEAIAAAEANLISARLDQERAQEFYDKTLECVEIPTGDEICPLLGPIEERARFQLGVADANLEAVQVQFDNVQSGPDQDTVGIAQANLAAAVAQRDASQAQLDLLLAGPTTADIAAAEAQLAQATATLTVLTDGPTAEQLARAQAQVEQARIGLERAQNNLDKATLRAPFAGTVTAVSVAEGEIASGPVVTLIDMESLEVVLDVDEIDVGELEVGQAAIVTLETWPDQEIESDVVSIAPEANSDVLGNGIVTYEVHLRLGETALPLRSGLTANAQLLIAEREDVLLVPNRAIRADRQSGRFYVDRIVPGTEEPQVEEVEVTIGLRDDQYTQITSGLEEGDEVRIGQIRAANPFAPPNGE